MNTATKLFEEIILAFYTCYDEEGAISPEVIWDLTPYLSVREAMEFIKI